MESKSCRNWFAEVQKSFYVVFFFVFFLSMSFFLSPLIFIFLQSYKIFFKAKTIGQDESRFRVVAWKYYTPVLGDDHENFSDCSFFYGSSQTLPLNNFLMYHYRHYLYLNYYSHSCRVYCYGAIVLCMYRYRVSRKLFHFEFINLSWTSNSWLESLKYIGGKIGPCIKRVPSFIQFQQIYRSIHYRLILQM